MNYCYLEEILVKIYLKNYIFIGYFMEIVKYPNTFTHFEFNCICIIRFIVEFFVSEFHSIIFIKLLTFPLVQFLEKLNQSFQYLIL